MDTKHWWLYVLELEQNKWYVGITSQTPEARLRQHQNNFLGAKWTKKYRPLSIHSQEDLGVITVGQAQVIENQAVRTYIRKYGLNQVRGGDISTAKTLVPLLRFYIDSDTFDNILYIWILLLIILVFAAAYQLKP